MTTAHRQLTVADLSPDQGDAYGGIMTWLNRGTLTKRTLTLGGYAGSGKSALVSVLAHEMPSPLAFCAFTGKASSVLGRKLAASGISTVNRLAAKSLAGDGLGVPTFEPRPYCGTIHGLVYRPCDACMIEKTYEHTYGPGCTEEVECSCPEGAVEPHAECPLHGEYATVAARDGKCLGCNPPPPVKRDGHCTRCGNNRYLRRERLDRSYRLIVIDEASMVSDDMLDALLSYGIPILAVGDHGQLPPVKGQGSLMKAPDLRLEKIHRQAEGNPIIALSKSIRETGDIDDRLEDGKAFTILSDRKMNDWIAKRFSKARLAADPMLPEGILGSVLVCWMNRTRVSLNRDVRDALELGGIPPTKSEAVICLKNKAPIYNGMRGVLMYDAIQAGDAGGKAPKWKASVDFVEDSQRADNILMSGHQFFEEKTIDYDKAQAMGVSMSALGELYDFGYAMTCHKMQGSQASEVGVYAEGGLARLGREERTRWLYTAVTRAAERLTVIR